MLRVNNIDLSPQNLLQNSAAPQGLMPPPSIARGGTQDGQLAGTRLVARTLRQVDTSQLNGVGGRLDLLG